jgi:hypothetical protein
MLKGVVMPKQKSLILLFLLFTIHNSQFTFIFSQPVQQEWVARYNNANHGAAGLYVITDSFGNIYVTGSVNTSSQGTDIVTIKYNSSGIQQWTMTYNGPGNGDDGPQGIALDDSLNVYIAGYSVGIGTGQDGVVIKYNSNGIQKWVTRFNGPNNLDDDLVSPVIDNSGNLYVTGLTVTSNSNGGYADVITIKYNTYTGDSIWTREFHETSTMGHYFDGCGKVALDKLGNIIVTGQSEYIVAGSIYYTDYLTLKYNASGNLQWYKKYGGSTGNGSGAAYLLVIDSVNNIYISGYSYNANNADIVTIKYDQSGTQQWLARYNGIGNGQDGPSGMEIDKFNNIYITGGSQGLSGRSDFLTIKYDLNGDSLWVKRYHGPNNNFDDNSVGLILDDTNNIYITGTSYNTNNGIDIATIKYSANGVQQWLIRYLYAGVSSEIVQPIAVDGNRNIFITGWDRNNGDMITIKYSQLTGIQQISNKLPEKFNLYQNFPNPFNPTTNIEFDIPKTSNVEIKVHDLLGREVAELVDEKKQAGKYKVIFNASNLSSGVYFYTIQIDGINRSTKSMALIK